MSHRSDFYLLLATIVLSGLTAYVYMARPLSGAGNETRPNLELQVTDQKGLIRVDWNAADPMVQSAQGATLEVEDGGAFNRYPVDPTVLHSGGLDYKRRSEDVLLTLTLYHDGRPGAQTSVRRIAPIGGSAVASSPNRQERGQSRTRRR